jgi:hypothetical protein
MAAKKVSIDEAVKMLAAKDANAASKINKLENYNQNEQRELSSSATESVIARLKDTCDR